MSKDLEDRVAELEAAVADLQKTVAELRAALAAGKPRKEPVLRSAGMLDRPRTGR